MPRPPRPLLENPTGVGRKRVYQPAILEVLKWGAARPIDIQRAMGETSKYFYIVAWLRAMEKCGLLKCTRVRIGRTSAAYYQLIEDSDKCLVPTQAEAQERAAAARRATREAWHLSRQGSTAERREAAMSLAAAWPERV